jgi:uncharacterized protein YprB with RNaseH-like and TPR domain
MGSLDRLRELVRGGRPGFRPPASVGPASVGPASVGPASVGPASVGPASVGTVRELTYEPVDAAGQPFPTRLELPALPGASLLDTPLGRVVVIDHAFAADDWHGRVRVRDGEVAPDELFALGDRRRAARPGDEWRRDSDPASTVLFLDLETTGISGGAGTVAFLVGCGSFVDGAFRTRQFLLPGFSAERTLLGAVTALLSEVRGLVTYNGRTFDVPVMETRWLFHRLELPWESLAHLDMLHLARRLWRKRADRAADPGCRLVTLERDLLSVFRVGDVEGWEIPARYFEYIRRGDAAVLAPVLYHNRIDLLSLACLTARAARLLREGADAALDEGELVALGREYARIGLESRAEECFRRVLAERFCSAECRAEAVHGLARLLRRQRAHGEAAALWRELAIRAERDVIKREAQEALAVHHEHRTRDLEEARTWAVELGSTGPPTRRSSAAYRLRRIDRKRARQSLPLPLLELSAP